MGTYRFQDMRRHSFFSSAPKQSQPVEYDAVRGVPYYQAYQAYQPASYQYQHVASPVAAPKKSQPPRLSPLMIPIRRGPKPICISQPKPQLQQQQQQWQGPYYLQRPRPQEQPRPQLQHQAVPAVLSVPRPQPRQRSEEPRPEPAQQQTHLEPPQRPPPRPPKVAKVELEDDIDFFGFQYPCMLPPETITLGPRPVSDSTNQATPTVPSPRYSLPALPSQSPHTLQRSKPYLQSRRQRIPTRDSVRPMRRPTRDELHGVAPAVQTAFPLAQPARKDSGQWYDFVEDHGNGNGVRSGESTPTPVARPETPLEYRARQAAALHDLLGQVLGGENTKENKEAAPSSPVWNDGGITILEEEVELAARGYRKFSAEEYLRELREILNSFDSPI